MWATLLAFFQAIPVIGSGLNKVIALFTKTPEQQAQQVASDTQTETNQINQTGRPE